MATIDSIHILKEYLTGVLDRANHHAHNVNEIALAIAGGIIWRTTNNIKVLSREGEMKNVLWLLVDDKRLCFVYNHDTFQIDIGEKSIQGKTIVSFDNKTPLKDVKDFFENL
ncbi:hypothetical protein RBH94_08410 [Aestuariibaculum sp. YM273]|uniref:hypothetical protein n=1 Tax=Aestuariibaculum sp. YM273 TaxID=3070659 RepID=UPI0027DCF7E2|nr:hypothetical protein [Aestuariibaculum sp. YM273]WMI64092.1 hypothetical protein RBH94_08410 [Aestuariibaculum sp. YM273]